MCRRQAQAARLSGTRDRVCPGSLTYRNSVFPLGPLGMLDLKNPVTELMFHQLRRPHSGSPVKGRDLTVALPKFYVTTIDELPDVFFAASSSGHTNSIALLTWPSSSRMYARYSACAAPQGNLSSTEIVFCQFGSRVETKSKT
jgi:hypothetical protein